MKPETWYKEKLAECGDDVDFLTDAAIIDFTEKIVDKMKEMGMSRADLADKLGVSKPFVTKLLNGNPNMTIRTMVNIAHALDCEICLEMFPKNGKRILSSMNLVEPIKKSKITEIPPKRKKAYTLVQ